MAKRKKQTTIRCTQYPETMGVILLTIVVTAFMVGTGIYFWLNASGNTAENALKNKIDILETRLTTSEKETEAVSLVKEEVSETAEDVSEVIAEAPFNRCAHLSTFIYENWYPDLRNAAKNKRLSLSDATSACFSEAGQVLAFLIPKTECQGSEVYRFNLSNSSLKKADLDDKGRGCLATVEEFGKRTGPVIQLQGTEVKDGCRTDQYFDYDYTKNTVELQSEYGICTGKEGKLTEY